MGSHKAAQDLLNTTMETLTLSISLWVISSGKSYFTIQQGHKACPEHTGEPRIPVRDNLLWHPKLADPVIKEQLGGGFSIQGSSTWNEAHELAEPIHHSEDCVNSTLSHWQMRDEVHRDLLKRLRRRGKRLQQTNW